MRCTPRFLIAVAHPFVTEFTALLDRQTGEVLIDNGADAGETSFELAGYLVASGGLASPDESIEVVTDEVEPDIALRLLRHRGLPLRAVANVGQMTTFDVLRALFPGWRAGVPFPDDAAVWYAVTCRLGRGPWKTDFDAAWITAVALAASTFSATDTALVSRKRATLRRVTEDGIQSSSTKRMSSTVDLKTEMETGMRLSPGPVPGKSVLLSIRDVTQLYRVSRAFAYSLKQRIPSYRLGGIKFRREDVERLLELELKVVPSGRGPAPAKRKPSRRSSFDSEESPDEKLRLRYGV